MWARRPSSASAHDAEIATRIRIEVSGAICRPGGLVHALVNVALPEGLVGETDGGTPSHELRVRLACHERIDVGMCVASNEYETCVGSREGSGGPSGRRRAERVVGRTDVGVVPLRASSHAFDVQIDLPPDLPPSFAGAAASYVYALDARVHRWQDDDGVVAGATHPIRVWAATPQLLTIVPQQHFAMCVDGAAAGSRMKLASEATPAVGDDGSSPPKDYALWGGLLKRQPSNPRERRKSVSDDYSPGNIDAPFTYNISCDGARLVHLSVIGMRGGKLIEPGGLLECVLEFGVAGPGPKSEQGGGATVATVALRLVRPSSRASPCVFTLHGIRMRLAIHLTHRSLRCVFRSLSYTLTLHRFRKRRLRSPRRACLARA